MERIGEIAALGTAVCWTVTAIVFESAGKKVGSVAVNIVRLTMAFVLLAIFTSFNRGLPLPLDASLHTWFWLLLSGLVGFVIGDLFLFKAFTVIGGRLSMLIMTLAPPFAAIIGFFLLGEKISWLGLLGMSLTVSGIGLVIFTRKNKGAQTEEAPQHIKQKNSVRLKGILFAMGGALGQAGGLVLSKFGMEGYDPFAATQIRVIAGIIGFVIIITLLRRWPQVNRAIHNKPAMGLVLIGATFGPFIGVSLSLFAVQHTATGIASTIMAITPIIIIPPSILLFKQKVSLREVIGAVVSVVGVSLFFI